MYLQLNDGEVPNGIPVRVSRKWAEFSNDVTDEDQETHSIGHSC